MTASSEEGSTDDTESLSDSSDSADEEIREIERRDNNPFNTMSIPKEKKNKFIFKKKIVRGPEVMLLLNFSQTH